MFHSLADAFGMLVITAGTYVVRATSSDGIVHLAALTVGSVDDYALVLPCRGLIIDRHGGALSHLRRPDTPVDCMTCLTRGQSP